MRNFVIFITILILFSCSSNCKDVTTILLPDNMALLSGNYRNHYDGIYSEVRMIAYYDSAFCTNCAIKNFYIWNRLINTVESYNNCASIVFIFAPKHSDLFKIETLLEEYVVDYPVYLDTAYYFGKINPQIKQSFFGIIDKENEVILSGYPFDSSKKYKRYNEMFKSIVTNKN